LISVLIFSIHKIWGPPSTVIFENCLHLTALNVVGSLGGAEFAYNMAELMAMADLYLGILSIEKEN